MNTDFRLSIGLTSNPKTIKLMRRCGDRAFFCLIQLWGWVAQYRPDGDLVGMDTEAIEIAAGWAGVEGQLVEQLSAIGFLDGEDGAYSLHDWKEHNPWASGATARSEAASKAGKASAAKRAEKANAISTDSNEEVTDVERALATDSNEEATTSPSPSPSPSPKEEKEKYIGTASKAKRFSPPTLQEVSAYCIERGNSVDPQRWIDHYTANGWKVGKNPMRDWQAAVRTWEDGGAVGVVKPAKTGRAGSQFETKDYGESGRL